MTFFGLLPSHIAPFEGVPAWAIACVIASYFFGFFVRGAFGFGSNMPIVLLTTWLLGPHHAILLTAVAALAAQLHLLPQLGGKGILSPCLRPTRGAQHGEP